MTRLYFIVTFALVVVTVAAFDLNQFEENLGKLPAATEAIRRVQAVESKIEALTENPNILDDCIQDTSIAAQINKWNVTTLFEMIQGCLYLYTRSDDDCNIMNEITKGLGIAQCKTHLN